MLNYYGPQCPCGLTPCLCPVSDTGAIVRDPVLSPGFYWYDAPPEQAAGFQAWLRDNAAIVKARKTVTELNASLFGSSPHLWVLFEVIFPVLWLDAKKFGFPNTATKDTDSTVASSGAEPQKDVLDQIADSVKSTIPFLAPVSSGVLVLGGLLGLGYIFRKEIFEYGVSKANRIRASRNR